VTILLTSHSIATNFAQPSPYPEQLGPPPQAKVIIRKTAYLLPKRIRRERRPSTNNNKRQWALLHAKSDRCAGSHANKYCCGCGEWWWQWQKYDIVFSIVTLRVIQRPGRNSLYIVFVRDITVIQYNINEKYNVYCRYHRVVTITYPVVLLTTKIYYCRTTTVPVSPDRPWKAGCDIFWCHLKGVDRRWGGALRPDVRAHERSSVDHVHAKQRCQVALPAAAVDLTLQSAIIVGRVLFYNNNNSIDGRPKPPDVSLQPSVKRSNYIINSMFYSLDFKILYIINYNTFEYFRFW